MEERRKRLKRRQDIEEDAVVRHGEAWLFTAEDKLEIAAGKIWRHKTTTAYLVAMLNAVESGKRTLEQYDAKASSLLAAESAREKALADKMAAGSCPRQLAKQAKAEVEASVS